MSPLAMSGILVVLLGLFAWSMAQRLRLMTRGPGEPRFGIEGDDLAERIRGTVVYAFGQKKMPYYRWAGIAHVLIFSAFNVLLLNSAMLWGRGFDPEFNFWGILSTENFFGATYSVAKEIFALLCILGASVFLYYRTVSKQKRMSHSGEAFLILGIIITMMLADFLYVGSSLVLHAHAAGTDLVFHGAEPIGSLWAFALSGASDGTLTVLQHFGFWWHSSFVLIFLNILPYSKHFHILTSIPNVFARPLHPNALPTIVDIEGKVEREEAIGFSKITDLSWKDALDLYTCTECGRCSDNCPAFITDKKLSPKHVTLALRDHLYASESYLINKGTAADLGDFDPAKVENPEMHHADPPAGAYFTPNRPVDLIPNVIAPEVIWACTTCRACEEQCPVMISYVDKFIQMRRDLVMMKNEFPNELMAPFNGIETNGNPWNMSAMDRANWTDGLTVPLIADNKDAEVLYWVGCAASYDDRAKKIARATVLLFQQANVNFAILGTEETCTGDPARRAGNEYLFQTMAAQNVETLNGYEASKKKIVTTCPHCFNTLANEYPDFGGKFEVVHHTTYLKELLDAGKIKPTKKLDVGPVVFHDSCYLGRYNDVYDAPRELLAAIPGMELREVNYWNKNRGLCCGAGGAQMFMEEHGKQRVNVKRTLQLLETGAKTIAAGCPFCMTMITDGLKAEEKEEAVKPYDVAELLAMSAGLGMQPKSDAAE